MPLKLNDAARNDDRVKLRVTIEKPTGIGKSGATLYLAIADGASETQVKRGENAVRVLKHVAVVRSLSAVGSEDFSKEVEIKIPACTGVAGLERVCEFANDAAAACGYR